MANQLTWQYVPNFVPTTATNNGVTAPSSTYRNIVWAMSRCLLGDTSGLTFKDSTGATISQGSMQGVWICLGSSDGSGASGTSSQTTINNGGGYTLTTSGQNVVLTS